MSVTDILLLENQKKILKEKLSEIYGFIINEFSETNDKFIVVDQLITVDHHIDQYFKMEKLKCVKPTDKFI